MKGYAEEMAGRKTGAPDYANLLSDEPSEEAWHVLWTKSNCERLVYDQLSGRGYDVFLPMISQWSSTRNMLLRVPMFKSYLFIHGPVKRNGYIDICKARGLVSILGRRWDMLAQVPEQDIESIRVAAQSNLVSRPYPYLEEGDRVKVTKGALANAEGVLLRVDQEKGLFVLSVDLLRRSIAVEVSYTDVEPVCS